jgi:hypothetical protein
MTFFRKRTKFRSFAAICAAYAVILHAFFGGIVLGQNAAAATPFVICQGLGDSGGTNDHGEIPVKQFPCSQCCAVHAAGTLPLSAAEIVFAAEPGAPLLFLSLALPARSDERSPKLAQAPPATA